MPQETLFVVGDEVQWKRRDLVKTEVDCLLHSIENLGLIGPFRIIKVDNFPSTRCPKPNERLVTILDQKTQKEKQFGSWWFEKYSG